MKSLKNFVIMLDKHEEDCRVVKDIKFYIVFGVNEYKEEIHSLIIKNKTDYPFLENQIKSWGGNIKLVSLKEIIKFYAESLFAKS